MSLLSYELVDRVKHQICKALNILFEDDEGYTMFNRLQALFQDKSV